MKFKQFLIEFAYDNIHYITYQKIIHAIDNAHVEKTDRYYSFNLGNVIKSAEFNNLDMRIQLTNRPGNTDVKLGKSKTDRYTLVIFVDELPERSKIDSLLSSDKSILNGFAREIKKYKELAMFDQNDDKTTAHEKREILSDRNKFEENYDKLITALNDKFKKYKIAHKELEDEVETTANILKKSSLKIAMKKLKEDMLGKTAREFFKKAYKLPDGEFAAYLDKEMLNKLNKRLESYYEEKV